MFAASHRAGRIKSARTWVMLGEVKSGSAIKGKHQRDELVLEREEFFVLQNAWPRGPDQCRAITYVGHEHHPKQSNIHGSVIVY